MKNYIMFIMALCMILFSGCELVGDIFEAGVWVGVLVVVGLLLLALFLINKIRNT